MAQDDREQTLRIIPLRVNASVWQTPVWVMRISTSPFWGGATSISTTCSG